LTNEIEFIKPIDGDVLFCVADGVEENGSLITTITITAPKNRTIRINGINAVWQEGKYAAQISLDAYRNAVEAKCEETGESQTIYIYWFKDGYMTYRFAVDDVIWCFENIYKHQDTYRSIFDDPFLALFIELHETYQTKVHMHIYYQTEDGSFNLSMFPDKYKSEFIKNSSWLKFTFHSLCNMPESPYKHASYEQVMHDGRLIEKEIRRFAGSEVLSSVTSEHFADSNIYATRAFRSLGYKVLDGYFIFDQNGDPYVSYYFDRKQTTHAHSRDFWVDNKEDIIFVKDDIVINAVDLDQIDPYMNELKAAEDHCFMYLLIHEQYFYKNYINYQEDYKEKIFKTVRWCVDNGYRTTSISDIAFEKKLNAQDNSIL
jgi:hypothetical protein